MEAQIHNFVTSESRTSKSEFKEYLESQTKDDLVVYYKSIGYKPKVSMKKSDYVDFFLNEFTKTRKNLQEMKEKTYTPRVSKKEINVSQIISNEEDSMFSPEDKTMTMKFPKTYNCFVTHLYNVKHKTYPMLDKKSYPSNIKSILYFDKIDLEADWYPVYDINMIALLENNNYVLHIVEYSDYWYQSRENNVYVFKTYEDLINSLPLSLYNDFIKNTKKA